MPAPAQDPYGWLRKVGSLISIPLLLGVSPVVGAALGYGMDHWLDTRPIFTILLLAAGFMAGVRETWLLIRKADTTPNDEERNSKNGLSHR